jgi:tellurite resistance protein TerC
VSTEFWIFTIVGLMIVFGVDLYRVALRPREIEMADAGKAVGLYVGLALVFGLALLLAGPPDIGQQFFAGYVTEYSLSIDNLFVFLIVMERFAGPGLARNKALTIGIVLSLVMRGLLILAGAAAIARASATFFLFSALLVYTAVKLVFEGDPEPNFEEGRVLRGLRRLLPIADRFDGSRVVVRRGGRLHATPLALVIAAIAIANVVFALDSIPAIFGLSSDTFVILTANAFAMLGLRQLYFLIGGLLGRLTYLNAGLAAILAFVGIKLFLEALNGSHVDSIASVSLPQIGTSVSLAFVLLVLLITAAVSLLRPRDDVIRSEQTDAPSA